MSSKDADIGKPRNREEAKFKRQTEAMRLRQEVKELREALNMDQSGHTLETWQSLGSQTVRDRFAARAFIAELGHTARALQRLGFQVLSPTHQWRVKEVNELANVVFNTPGVQEILDVNLKDMDESWTSVVARTREIALHGEPQTAVKAASLLAKIEARYKEADKQSSPVVSLHVLVNNNKTDGQSEVKVIETHDPLALLSHEPSEIGTPIDQEQALK